ncbi:MAG TPA: DUF861 domain-containing protein [bacterium]|nr:DUF861 domain-containing protein [bacterium]
MKISIEKPSAEKLESLGVKSWPIWEKEESTFDWHYDEKEACYILEGRVTVKTDSETVSFGAGDFVVFPAGLSCVWTIHKAVKKHYKFG